MRKLIALLRRESDSVDWPQTLRAAAKWLSLALLRGLIAGAVIIDLFIIAALVTGALGDLDTGVALYTQHDVFLMIREILLMKIQFGIVVAPMLAFWGALRGKADIVSKSAR